MNAGGPHLTGLARGIGPGPEPHRTGVEDFPGCFFFLASREVGKVPADRPFFLFDHWGSRLSSRESRLKMRESEDMSSGQLPGDDSAESDGAWQSDVAPREPRFVQGGETVAVADAAVPKATAPSPRELPGEPRERRFAQGGETVAVADAALPAAAPGGVRGGGTVAASSTFHAKGEGRDRTAELDLTSVPVSSRSDLKSSRADLPTEKVPERIGQYELIRELGRGGMGVVYLARDSRLGRRVAVKLLQTDHHELTERFIVEARATAQCSHENIVVIHEVGEHQGTPFMVLEYLKGQTLAEIFERTGAMQWTRAADVMVAVVRALAKAHSVGIVHRDLKPENIFLTESGTVKVLDFGIAKVLREEAPLRERAAEMVAPKDGRTGIVGTLAYMAPEQWQAGERVDHRADIWAVGLILFEMLAGKHPLLDHLDHLQQQVTRPDWPMPSLRAEKPDVVPELAEVVERCLQKSPDARFSHAEELLKALEPFLPGRFRAWGNFDKGPYTGLRAFQEEDAACFFGRSAEISALVTRIFDYPMIAVVGPSGIGKSSFVRAGVVPALRSFGTAWRILVVRPGRQPLVSLATMLHQLRGVDPSIDAELTDATNLGIRLRMEPGYLGNVLRTVARRTGERCMMFVDQFEELYTLCEDPEQRRCFTNCLTGAADDATAPVRLVMSVRSDFLGRVGEDAHFMAEVSQGLFFLGPPGPEGLREALVQPAEMMGYRFETTEMVDEMIGHLRSTPGALPLLQFTAFQLWERRDAGLRLLTKRSYDELGGISGALASHADQVIQKQSPDARALCRALFLQLVTPEKTRAVRELQELEEIVGSPETLRPLLDDLVQSRLLVLSTGGGGGGATVELIHESLIEAWLTLRRWLEESHEDSMFLEQLRAAARQWQTKNRDAGLLWTGEMAEELGRFRRRYKGELSETVRAFVEAVYAHTLRRARIKRFLAVSGVGVLLALLAAAAVALVVIRRAQKEAEHNELVARQAQEQAQARLLALQEKEKARQREASKRQKAEKQVARANTTIELTNEELAQKNRALLEALRKAEAQRRAAEDAQHLAEKNEAQARQAEERTRQLLRAEKKRVKRLSERLGSSVVEQLK